MSKQITIEDAFSLIQTICREKQGSADDHDQIRECLRTIAYFINKGIEVVKAEEEEANSQNEEEVENVEQPEGGESDES